MESKPYSVLVTASGLSPVGLNTIASLKSSVGKVVGVDINETSYAKELCDAHYQVPFASDDHYADTIEGICAKEDIDTILPLTIEETIVLKKHVFKNENIRIANANTLDAILICNDKLKTNEFLKSAGIDSPNAYSVSNGDDLLKNAALLGYPDRDIVFKPRITHGSRGFRIVTPKYDKLSLLIDHKPTDNILITLDELVKTVGVETVNCMLMDKLEGDDYSVYSFSVKGEPLVVIPMKRLGLVPGMSTGGEAVKNQAIIVYVEKIISAFGFSGSINFQLKLTGSGPLLYEINSRTSATTVFTRAFNLNLPLYEILLAHNHVDEIRKEISAIREVWGVKMNRVHKEVYSIDGTYFSL